MKTNIKINAVTKEIIMTKTTEKKASIIDTPEYKDLIRLRKDFPDFTVKILSPKAKASKDKGLTMELMEKLISVMTDDGYEAVNRFALVKESYKGTNFHFSKPKAYFLAHYPDWRDWLPEAEEKKPEDMRKANVLPLMTESERVENWSQAGLVRPTENPPQESV